MFEVGTINTKEIYFYSPGCQSIEQRHKNFIGVTEEHTRVEQIHTDNTQSILLLKGICVMHFYVDDAIIGFTFGCQLKTKSDPPMTLVSTFVIDYFNCV